MPLLYTFFSKHTDTTQEISMVQPCPTGIAGYVCDNITHIADNWKCLLCEYTNIAMYVRTIS
jgi:hypothetical protein